MAKLSGGEALIKSLVREGVEVIFGLPGVQMYGIVAALRDEPSIKFVVTRNETSTTYMADGEQYVVIPSTGGFSLKELYPNLVEYGDAFLAFKIKD